MADVIDQRLSAELAEARRLEATTADVDAVLARLTRAPRRRRPIARRVSTVALIGALGIVTVAGATGVTILSRDQPTGKAEPRLTTPTYIVAQGHTPHFGAWRLLLTGSDQGDCLGLQLLESGNAAESAPIMESCGGDRTLSLAVYRDSRATLAYGRAPSGASEIRIEAGDDAVLVRPAESARGTFYVAELPGRPTDLRTIVQTPDGSRSTDLRVG
jgi:hypothetical protein